MSLTVQERLKAHSNDLTRAERQLASTIMEGYPTAGLVSITRLAETAGVSTPTVVRFAQKLGFSGFPNFQDALREEVAAQISTPIAKHDHWAATAPQTHVLNAFTDQVVNNLRQTLSQIEAADFDRAAELLAEKRGTLFVTGGRISHAMAEYFSLHMQVIRPRVVHVRSTDNAWPHYLLDVGPDDIVVVYDIRRYETGTLRLAEMARERGATILLFTDQWRSPVATLSDITFSCRIEVPSAWDSSVALMLLSETLIAATQDRNWEETRSRMGALETLFDKSRTFKKFI